MKNKLSTYRAIALLTLALAACQRQEAGLRGMATLSLSIAREDGTRSAWNGDEDMVSTLQVAAYRVSDRALMAFTSGTSLQLPTGYDYRFYTLVNCPETVFPANEAGLDTLRVSIPWEDAFPDGIPMAGMDFVQVRGFSQDISLNVKRLVARLDFGFVDRDGLGFTPSYIKVKQAAADVAPWRESAAVSARDGDSATQAECSAFAARLYVPENSGAADPGLRTYLEVGMDFPEGGPLISNPDRVSERSDVIYRLYLGSGGNGNADVVRNSSIRLTLTATEAALMDGEMSWSIDSDLGYGGEETVRAMPWDISPTPLLSDQSPEVPAPVTVIDSVVGTRTVVVPEGMNFADIFIVSGGESGQRTGTGAAMGGAGGYVWWTSVRVSPGTAMECTVGAGGAACSENGRNEGEISSVTTPFATYRADSQSNYNTQRRRTSSVPAPDGVANPFDSADACLYGASGAGAAGYTKPPQTPGKTGGGGAGTKTSTATDGSFFGAGGGGSILNTSGAGHSGVAIIYFRPY